MRQLIAIADAVAELTVVPQSFCQVPTFGRDTICRFRRNVSELKKMAARDFEDILQVSVGISTIVILLNLPGAIVFYSSFHRTVARSS